MNKLLTIITLLVFASTSLASNQQDADIIKQLYNSGKVIEAYELGLALEDKLAGDPTFDFYFGMSAIRSGDASKGVYTLERIQYAEPDSPRLAFELGKGYYDLEEFAQSKQLFQKVMDSNPPKDVEDISQQYLDAIKRQETNYKSSWGGAITLQAGHDSNANYATNDRELKGINPKLQSLLSNFKNISDSSRAQNSQFTNLIANVNYNKPFSPNWSFNSSLNAGGNRFDNNILSATDSGNVGLGLGLNQKIGNKNTLNYGLNFQQLYTNGKATRTAPSLTTAWQHQLSNKAQLQSFLRLSQLNSIEQESRQNDTQNITLGTSYYRQITSWKSLPLVSLGLALSQSAPQNPTDSNRASLGKNTVSLNTGINLSTSKKSRWALNLGFSQSEFDGKQLIFATQRSDQTLNTGLSYQYLMGKNLSFKLATDYSQNDSNININAYEKTRYYLSSTYAF